MISIRKTTINFLFVCFAFLFLPIITSAQEYVCDCKTDLEFLDQKVKKSPAYKRNKEAYSKAYEKLAERTSAETSIFDCYIILNELLLSINDNHSRVYGIDKGATPEVTPDSMAYAEFKKSETNTLYPILKVDLDSLETILESKDVNDIVGVYTYKEQLKIGVVKEENSDNFKVVILDTNEDIWQKGEVMSTLIPYGDNLLLNVGGNPSTKRLIAYSERIEDGVFKYIGFTKNNDHVHFANDLPTEETYFKEEINENITYLRLGSFSGWNPTLGQAEKFYREIKGTLTKPNLIVDLRNNSGGGDRNSDIILKQLKSYSKKNAIFVLINHRTVSNAEHFTLKLAKLKNTTILGNPSNGTAAYEVKNSTFNLPSGKFVTVLTSKLHSKYLDIESKGIIPDVVLDSGSDWIEQTVEYINGKK